MKVTLKNVRLSFPNLFVAKAGKEGDKEKFSCHFIMESGSEAHKTMSAAIRKVAAEEWGEKAEDTLTALKAADKICLRDGAIKSDYAGYAGMVFTSASNDIKPRVADQSNHEVKMSDGIPYSGAYVYGYIDVWAQDNKWGKRVNASLRGVQMFKDGERLSGGGVSGEDEFEVIPTDDGDAAETSDDLI